MTATKFQSFLRRHGWTAYAFARDSGLPRSTIYDWAERGVNRYADRLLLAYIDRYPSLLSEPRSQIKPADTGRPAH